MERTEWSNSCQNNCYWGLVLLVTKANRFPCSPCETVIFGRGRKRVDTSPLFIVWGDERPDRTRTKMAAVDGGGRLKWPNTLLLCRGMCKKVIVRTDLAGEAQDSAWTQPAVFFTEERNGTNDHEQSRSVPSSPTNSLKEGYDTPFQESTTSKALMQS